MKSDDEGLRGFFGPNQVFFFFFFLTLMAEQGVFVVDQSYSFITKKFFENVCSLFSYIFFKGFMINLKYFF